MGCTVYKPICQTLLLEIPTNEGFNRENHIYIYMRFSSLPRLMIGGYLQLSNNSYPLVI